MTTVTRKTCRTMSAFYDRCGMLLRQYVVSSGAFPSVTHTAVFEYENGEARWDGRRWEWALDGGAV